MFVVKILMRERDERGGDERVDESEGEREVMRGRGR